MFPFESQEAELHQATQEAEQSTGALDNTEAATAAATGAGSGLRGTSGLYLGTLSWASASMFIMSPASGAQESISFFHLIFQPC